MLSDGSTNPKNNKDAHTDGKEHDDDIQNSVSPDSQSSSCGDQTREQGDKTENKDKGKSPVVTITGFKDLNEEFSECINNSSNGVSATGPSVFAAGLDFTNSTNDFSAAGPLVSPAELNLTNITNDFSDAALKDPSWIEAMQGELLQFKMQKVWILVDLPYGKRAIGTKWVYRNKKYERGIVVRNKARLVAQGHTQEEGIDYEECTKWMSKVHFSMTLLKKKYTFVNHQGFEDPEYPDKVYKVVKALYGLHQAPRAWYETLATYLLENGFQRGTIDQTLFIKKQQKDILLV
nr:hypothetical protein [Tanacetum cinerariifolium]